MTGKIQPQVIRRFDPLTAEAVSAPASGVIDLWLLKREVLGRSAEGGEAILSSEERARARRFRFSRDRERFIVGRAALRRLLGSYLGVPPHSVAFAYGPHGKPRLADTVHGTPPIFFNLSHSAGLALIAVSPDCEVGVDIEAVRPLTQVSEMAAAVFSDEDQAALAATPEAERELAFYRMWTAMEACLKAASASLGMSATDGEAGAASTAPGQRGGAGDWDVIVIEPAANYVGALAVSRGRALTVRGWLLLE